MTTYYTISDGNGNYLASSRNKPDNYGYISIATSINPNDPYSQWSIPYLQNIGSGYYLCCAGSSLHTQKTPYLNGTTNTSPTSWYLQIDITYPGYSIDTPDTFDYPYIGVLFSISPGDGGWLVNYVNNNNNIIFGLKALNYDDPPNSITMDKAPQIIIPITTTPFYTTSTTTTKPLTTKTTPTITQTITPTITPTITQTTPTTPPIITPIPTTNSLSVIQICAIVIVSGVFLFGLLYIIIMLL